MPAVAERAAGVAEVKTRFRVRRRRQESMTRGYRDKVALPPRGEGLKAMKNKILGVGLGLTMATLGVVAVPAGLAFADSSSTTPTCYTGCQAPQQGTTPTEPAVTPVVAPVVPKQAPTSGGLPFTGADIESMAAVGAGSLVLGGVLVRRSRRHGHSAA